MSRTHPIPLTTAPEHRRGMAFALVAALLGEDTTVLADGGAAAVLGQLLELLGEDHACSRLGEHAVELTAAELAGRRVRWFEHGRIAPYEGSHVPATAGGVTPRLADVAGFYRAFGMSVDRERPDHVVAELEFVALVLLNEAEAIRADDAEGAVICADALRHFVRDHLGIWVDAWAARVSAEPALAPWAAPATVAALLVASEARRRNVVPLRPQPVLLGDAGVPDDDALAREPACGDDDSA